MTASIDPASIRARNSAGDGTGNLRLSRPLIAARSSSGSPFSWHRDRTLEGGYGFVPLSLRQYAAEQAKYHPLLAPVARLPEDLDRGAKGLNCFVKPPGFPQGLPAAPLGSPHTGPVTGLAVVSGSVRERRDRLIAMTVLCQGLAEVIQRRGASRSSSWPLPSAGRDPCRRVSTGTLGANVAIDQGGCSLAIAEPYPQILGSCSPEAYWFQSCADRGPTSEQSAA